jgi:DUF4097 and DUF4098 domain-containing protein YvlB
MEGQLESNDSLNKNKKKKAGLIVLLAIALVVAAFLILTGLGVINTEIFKEGFDMGYIYTNSDSYLVGSAEISASDIKEIDIDWVEGSVNIEVHTGDKLIISEPEDLEDADRLRYKVENGRLTIKFRKSSFFRFKPLDKPLTVKIPESYRSFVLFMIETVSANMKAASIIGDEVKLEAVSGNISIKDFTCNLMKVETVSGNIQIDNAAVEELKLEAVSGDINFIGNADDVDAETVSGTINLTSHTCPHTLDFESVSGDIKLRIPENDGFELRLETVSGDFSCAFPTTKERKEYVYKNGRADFKVETVSGDIKIERLDNSL